MMTSLDGYFEGENHDLSWHNVDEEFNDFAIKQLDEADTLVFGRTTYDMMASYWPTEEDDVEVASRMNSMQKVVFTHQPLTSDWQPTTVVSDIEKLRELKQQPGKSIAVLGSSNLCVSLLKAGLIDELRIMINPVVIGKGTTLFNGLATRCNFTLTDTRSFQNGNVLLRYKKSDEPE